MTKPDTTGIERNENEPKTVHNCDNCPFKKKKKKPIHVQIICNTIMCA